MEVFLPNQLFTIASTAAGGTITSATTFACFFIFDHFPDNHGYDTDQNRQHHSCAYDSLHNNHVLSTITFELLLLLRFLYGKATK